MKPSDQPPSSTDSTVKAFGHRLDHLRAEGRDLRSALARSADDSASLRALRVWQQECAETVSQLSGGSKAHWLSRAFSEALLVPTANGGSASVVTILDRLLGVIDSAVRSLADAFAPPSAAASGPPPARPRFTFVENTALRASLELAYLDGQDAFARGEFSLALMTFSSVLETIITDALEHHGLGTRPLPPGPVVGWPFTTRIAIAEEARLISRGCARLPQAAREYRDRPEGREEGAPDRSTSARDAKLTSDVLHVILRDLAPGR